VSTIDAPVSRAQRIPRHHLTKQSWDETKAEYSDTLAKIRLPNK
jgi:hypothetical protein